MQFNLKVKVLKKSKDAPYPEHVIVERKSTHEMVHLYFDNGALARLTHIVRDPQIRMAWDKKEKKYKTLLPNYLINQDTIFKRNGEEQQIQYLKRLNDQNFFEFIDGFMGESSSIGFKSHPDGFTDFYIEMDSNDKCIPNGYLADCGVADIREVYHHQRRLGYPLKSFFSRTGCR